MLGKNVLIFNLDLELLTTKWPVNERVTLCFVFPMSHSTHSATGSRNNIEQYQLPAIMYLNRLRLSHKYKKIIKYFALNYLYSAYQKKVIALCSALARSLYNLQKSFFRRRKHQAFSFRLSSFLWNLKKDWANTNQMKIAYFHLWALLGQRIRKENFINHFLSRETINITNKMPEVYYLS